MKLIINKKRIAGALAAVMLTGAAFGVLPVSAGLDEVVGENAAGYSAPVVREEVAVTKQTVTKLAQTERIAMEYRVRPGDTLWTIAERSGVTISKLAQANNLKQEDRILAGQVLTIPGSAASRHRVAGGETLSHIAASYGTTVKELMQANNLHNPDMIKVGLILNVPGETMEESLATAAGTSPEQISKIQIGGWAWPVAGEITSHFGIRGDRPHEGLDIGAGEGALIVAPESGRVIWAAPRGSYGLTVIMDHGNGIHSLYAHCSRLLVKEGQYIERNQPLAKVGNTGRSQGPHLHMEVLRQGIPLDPLLFLKERLFG